MVKMVFCVRRREGMSPEEFRAYWFDRHGPLVRQHAQTLRARRYVQSHRIDSPANAVVRKARGSAEPYDGIAEIWWDSLDGLYAAGLSGAGMAADRILVADERRFVDLARTAVFFTEEHEIFGGGPESTRVEIRYRGPLTWARAMLLRALAHLKAMLSKL